MNKLNKFFIGCYLLAIIFLFVPIENKSPIEDNLIISALFILGFIISIFIHFKLIKILPTHKTKIFIGLTWINLISAAVIIITSQTCDSFNCLILIPEALIAGILYASSLVFGMISLWQNKSAARQL